MIFDFATDYACFSETVAETLRIRRMQICGSCVMPNHWHMVLWPKDDGELAGVGDSVNRGSPHGDEGWATQGAERLGLGATMRPHGRPRTGAGLTHQP